MPAPFSPGLEGVVAAQTEISEVDGQNGRLIYRGGYLIRELAERSFEEVAYLLWHGELPQPGQLEELKRQLAANRNLNEQARAALKGLHPDVDPMDALRTVLSAQGAAPDCPKPTLEGAIAVTAVMRPVSGTERMALKLGLERRTNRTAPFVRVRGHGLDGLLFFDLERNDVRENLFGVGDQL